jgi:hypothetical protein
MREHSFSYVECSIPDGMTVQEHQRLRQEERQATRRWGRRIPRIPPLRKRRPR